MNILIYLIEAVLTQTKECTDDRFRSKAMTRAMQPRLICVLLLFETESNLSPKACVTVNISNKKNLFVF